MRAFTLSFCILFCHIWLLSLGGLLFSEAKERRTGSGEEWRLGEAGRGSGGETVVKTYCMPDGSVYNNN